MVAGVPPAFFGMAGQPALPNLREQAGGLYYAELSRQNCRAGAPLAEVLGWQAERLPYNYNS